WTSLRSGVRGGALAAGTAALVSLLVAAARGGDPALMAPLRGNLLAQCTTALLVGASSGWIRASEARYRQGMGHIPVALYSARVVRAARDGRPAVVEITLVSAACRQIFGCEPHELLGDYGRWLLRTHPADRELLTAAQHQMLLQKKPLTCEY